MGSSCLGIARGLRKARGERQCKLASRKRSTWISESSSVQPQMPSSAHIAAVQAARAARRQLHKAQLRCNACAAPWMKPLQQLQLRCAGYQVSCVHAARETPPRCARWQQQHLCSSGFLLVQHSLKLRFFRAAEGRVRQVDAVCAARLRVSAQRARRPARALTVAERRVRARRAAAAQVKGAAWRERGRVSAGASSAQPRRTRGRAGARTKRAAFEQQRVRACRVEEVAVGALAEEAKFARYALSWGVRARAAPRQR